MDFQGKVAIVTGGAQGIGRSYCSALLNMKMKVCICDIQEVPAKEFIATVPDDYKDNIMFQKCNVSCFDDFKAAFDKAIERFGRIDVLVNNAGICNEREWKKVIEVNFIGVIHGIHLAFQYMGVDNGGAGGYVINTASNTGFEPFPLGPIYSGCKHAVVGLTRSYGSEYHFKKTGVKVNAVCPGPVDTELFHIFPQMSIDEEEAVKLISNLNPVKPEEVGKALTQILEDDRNGALLLVDITGFTYV